MGYGTITGSLHSAKEAEANSANMISPQAISAPKMAFTRLILVSSHLRQMIFDI
jgi:hypothetical protein